MACRMSELTARCLPWNASLRDQEPRLQGDESGTLLLDPTLLLDKAESSMLLLSSNKDAKPHQPATTPAHTSAECRSVHFACLRQQPSGPNFAVALLAVPNRVSPWSLDMQTDALRPEACGDTACCYAGGVHTCCNGWRCEGVLCGGDSRGHCSLLCRLAV